MAGGCLVAATTFSVAKGLLVAVGRRQSTAVHYPASGRYLATKARRFVSMATCLDTITSGASGKRKQHEFWRVFILYKADSYYNWLRFRYIRLRFSYIRLRHCLISVPCYNNG